VKNGKIYFMLRISSLLKHCYHSQYRLYTMEPSVMGQLLEAVQFAAVKHRDQRRKDPMKTPYINHPIGVAHILYKEGGITDLTVLQVLHAYKSPI